MKVIALKLKTKLALNVPFVTNYTETTTHVTFQGRSEEGVS